MTSSGKSTIWTPNVTQLSAAEGRCADGVVEPREMSNSSSITILLIDSHGEDRQYWLQRLNISSQAYRVLEAETGAAGLDICRTQHVDCVVTELALPDMSGFEVLVHLVPRTTHPISLCSC